MPALVGTFYVTVRPALCYGYNAKLDAPSHYGLLLKTVLTF